MKKKLPALKTLFNQNLYIVATADFAFLQNPGEDAFARHDAVTGLVIDGAFIVAFLADLGDFDQHIVSEANPCAQRQGFPVNAG